MGWANCGEDSKGRPIGYAYAAKCDHRACTEQIDRGLAYACGGMHGEEDGYYCEKYFCPRHLIYTEFSDPLPGVDGAFLCFRCSKAVS